MDIVFGSNPFEPRQPDQAFLEEFEAARNAGLQTHVVSMESLFEEGDPQRAVRWIDLVQPARQAMFRGFMLTEERYTALFDALASRGLHLINTPEQYAFCHYLPNYYPMMWGVTPQSAWFEIHGDLDVVKLQEALAQFGDHAVVVKDFVKSEKHYWREACFIPWALDFEYAEKIVRRLLELRGSELNRGLVVRAFIPLAKADEHRDGPPGGIEARLFYLNGQRLLLRNYWDANGAIPADDALAILVDTIPRIRSNFFTVDVAQTFDGAWIIMELGDGQVAGLPPGFTPTEFYASIASSGSGGES